MAEEFDGPVTVNGELACGNLEVRLSAADKAAGLPAANFNSHVGVDGSIDCFGNLEVRLNAADKAAGLPAANFNSHVGVDGNIDCTGDIRLLGADCAEDFDVDAVEDVEPGSVMVASHDGRLTVSAAAYDRRAVGVVSGAGAFRPGLILDSQSGGGDRVAIGLIGKVYCKVDASHDPVEVGDLLTSAHTPGHAMKAADASKAFGAVIGKALAPLDGGRGLIPILVTLQ